MFAFLSQLLINAYKYHAMTDPELHISHRLCLLLEKEYGIVTGGKSGGIVSPSCDMMPSEMYSRRSENRAVGQGGRIPRSVTVDAPTLF